MSLLGRAMLGEIATANFWPLEKGGRQLGEVAKGKGVGLKFCLTLPPSR